MHYEQILYDAADGVATVTLNRPDRMNAWTMRMSGEVQPALCSADRDPAVRAIVVTGAGKGYCAGADMNLLQGLQGGTAAAVRGQVRNRSLGCWVVGAASRGVGDRTPSASRTAVLPTSDAKDPNNLTP